MAQPGELAALKVAIAEEQQKTREAETKGRRLEQKVGELEQLLKAQKEMNATTSSQLQTLKTESIQKAQEQFSQKSPRHWLGELVEACRGQSPEYTRRGFQVEQAAERTGSKGKFRSRSIQTGPTGLRSQGCWVGTFVASLWRTWAPLWKPSAGFGGIAGW